MHQFLKLKRTLTVFEAAQLMTQGKGGRHEAELLLAEAIEAGEFPSAHVVRWIITDYWNGDHEGNINQMETTFSRADLDKWLATKGLSIDMVSPANAPKTTSKIPNAGFQSNFLGVGQVLHAIAEKIELTPHFGYSEDMNIGAISRAAADKFWNASDSMNKSSINERIENARKISLAAQWLNKALHDSNFALQWWEIDEEKGFAVRSNNLYQEGIDLLTHATGWGRRQEEKFSTHFRNSITQGDDALAKPVPCKPNEGLTPDDKMRRLWQIGFDNDTLIIFLNEHDIEHSLTSLAVAPTEATDEKHYFIPLEDIAIYLANIQWGDNASEQGALLALEKLGVTSLKSSAVHLMRNLREHRIQTEIDRLQEEGKLKLYRKDELSAHIFLPTQDPDNAYVNKAEIAQLLQEEEMRDIRISSISPADTLPSSQLRTETQANVTVHKINTRLHVLSAEISKAKEAAWDDKNVASVWAELVKLAEKRFGCLLGLDEKDIKYQSGSEIFYFKKRNLSDRLRREAQRDKTR